jgi:hypothetical protein
MVISNGNPIQPFRLMASKAKYYLPLKVINGFQAKLAIKR